MHIIARQHLAIGSTLTVHTYVFVLSLIVILRLLLLAVRPDLLSQMSQVGSGQPLSAV